MKKWVSIMLVFVFIAGCAGMTDRQKTVSEGAGAAGGALLGAIVGQLIGKDTKGTLIGAAIGAAVGGGLGTAYGNHVAGKKAEYASQEAYLNACIASAQQVNEETRQYNVSLKDEINGLDKEVNKLLAQYKSKKAGKARVEKEQQKVQAKLSEAQAKLKTVQDEVEIQKQVLASERGKSKAELAESLDKEIALLEPSAKELDKQTQALASIGDRTLRPVPGRFLCLRRVHEIPRSERSGTCPIAWMDDLYELIREADRVLTF